MMMKTLITGILGVLSGLLLAGALLFFVLPERGQPIVISTTTPVSIYCQVDGAIKNPGLYSFTSGERVQDAVTKAGGLLDNADATSINLALVLSDGQKLHFPEKNEINPTDSQIESDLAIININTATLEQLETLPGIGPSKAMGIITYREQNGDFLNIRDILNVPGIGQSIFDKLETMITVN
jgi:competence protein ComEA